MTDTAKRQRLVYWVLTGIIVVTQGVSGVLDLIGAAPVLDGIRALGYPDYILYILGPAKIAGVIVLAIPGRPRLKEWAYAGLSIDFGGAFLSHLFNGDGLGLVAAPLVFLALLLGSYSQRPPDRRL